MSKFKIGDRVKRIDEGGVGVVCESLADYLGECDEAVCVQREEKE